MVLRRWRAFYLIISALMLLLKLATAFWIMKIICFVILNTKSANGIVPKNTRLIDFAFESIQEFVFCNIDLQNSTMTIVLSVKKVPGSLINICVNGQLKVMVSMSLSLVLFVVNITSQYLDIRRTKGITTNFFQSIGCQY